VLLVSHFLPSSKSDFFVKETRFEESYFFLEKNSQKISKNHFQDLLQEDNQKREKKFISGFIGIIKI